MNNNLLILGRGQYSYIAEEIARQSGDFNKIDFLDDNSAEAIGKTESYGAYIKEYSYAIVAIGNPKIRLKLTEELKKEGYIIPSLISKNAYVSATSKICEGCIIEPMAVVNPNTIIEECCFISAGAVVNHNSTLQRGCHIDCNATVMSNTIAPQSTKVACGVVYKNTLN